MNKLVGMTGKARSGKDTFAGVLVNNGEYVRVAFADEIKKDVAAFLGIRVKDIEARKDDFRATLQEYGSRMRRDRGACYWIVRAIPKVMKVLSSGWDVVITDVRYKIEATWVRSNGGVIVKRRRTTGEGAVGALALHSSETELDSIVPDYTCNCDTVEAIRAHAREFLSKPGGDV